MLRLRSSLLFSFSQSVLFAAWQDMRVALHVGGWLAAGGWAANCVADTNTYLGPGAFFCILLVCVCDLMISSQQRQLHTRPDGHIHTHT